MSCKSAKELLSKSKGCDAKCNSIVVASMKNETTRVHKKSIKTQQQFSEELMSCKSAKELLSYWSKQCNARWKSIVVESVPKETTTGHNKPIKNSTAIWWRTNVSQKRQRAVVLLIKMLKQKQRSRGDPFSTQPPACHWNCKWHPKQETKESWYGWFYRWFVSSVETKAWKDFKKKRTESSQCLTFQCMQQQWHPKCLFPAQKTTWKGVKLPSSPSLCINEILCQKGAENTNNDTWYVFLQHSWCRHKTCKVVFLFLCLYSDVDGNQYACWKPLAPLGKIKTNWGLLFP